MSGQFNAKLAFLGYAADEIHFERNGQWDETRQIDVDLRFGASLTMSEGHEKDSVSLSCEVWPSLSLDAKPFCLRVAVTGLFKVTEVEQGAAADDDRLLRVNAVAILFPYLRSMISTVTASANLRSLIIPPINVHALLADRGPVAAADESRAPGETS